MGTFGTVYRAMDHLTGRHVAVKRMVTPRDHGEVQALLHLDRAGGHPNICSLVEYCHDDVRRQSYLVMELVEGCEMFDHLVQQGAYSEFDAARLVREVGSALAFLHGVGVVHMDLKPENIMLSSINPSNAVIKLIDFGCAVITASSSSDSSSDSSSQSKPTAAVSLAGRTLAYCPPEVLEGADAAASPSADMFALGTSKTG
jgi:serine/threonine protein kinase